MLFGSIVAWCACVVYRLLASLVILWFHISYTYTNIHTHAHTRKWTHTITLSHKHTHNMRLCSWHDNLRINGSQIADVAKVPCLCYSQAFRLYCSQALCVCVCMCVCVCVCVCVCMCVCVCVCACDVVDMYWYQKALLPLVTVGTWFGSSTASLMWDWLVFILAICRVSVYTEISSFLGPYFQSFWNRSCI